MSLGCEELGGALYYLDDLLCFRCDATQFGATPMPVPPNDRLEFVLMATEDRPIHLWVQTNGDFAKLYEYDRKKSLQILGSASVLIFLMLVFATATAVFLLLLGLIIVVPLALVGMVGYWLGD